MLSLGDFISCISTSSNVTSPYTAGVHETTYGSDRIHAALYRVLPLQRRWSVVLLGVAPAIKDGRGQGQAWNAVPLGIREGTLGSN